MRTHRTKFIHVMNIVVERHPACVSVRDISAITGYAPKLVELLLLNPPEEFPFVIVKGEVEGREYYSIK